MGPENRGEGVTTTVDRDDDGGDGRSARRLPWGLVGWSLAVVLWLTWAPYRFRSPDPSLTVTGSDPAEVLANLALLAPLAIAVVLCAPGGGRSRLARAGLAALAASVVVEIGQMFIEGRHPSPMDLGLNASGGVLLAWLAVRLEPRLGAGRILTAVTLVAWGTVLGHSVLAAAAVERHHRIRGWEPSYPILMGDEVGGGRRYLGTIRNPAICAAGPEAPVCVSAGANPPSRARLAEAARKSQWARARATVVSTSDRQRGPARIVTFSDGTLRRNITLAQKGRALVFRIRTPVASPSGSAVEFYLSGAVPRGEPTTVSATFDQGRVEMRAATTEMEVRGSFYPGLLQAWVLAGLAFPEVERVRLQSPLSRLQLFPDLDLNRLGWLTALAAWVLVLPGAYGLGAWRSGSGPVGLVLGPAAVTAALFATDFLLGAPTPAGVLAIAATVAVAGVVVGAWDARRWAASGTPASRTERRSADRGQLSEGLGCSDLEEGEEPRR